MRRWSREFRQFVIASMCVSLLATHLLRVSASDSLIGDIEAKATSSRFVQPTSQSGILRLEAMGKIASLINPVSELPADHWLLDDAEVPELPAYLAGADLGKVENREEDDGTAYRTVMYATLITMIVSAAAALLGTTVVSVRIAVAFGLAAAGAGALEVTNEVAQNQAKGPGPGPTGRYEAPANANKANLQAGLGQMATKGAGAVALAVEEQVAVEATAATSVIRAVEAATPVTLEATNGEVEAQAEIAAVGVAAGQEQLVEQVENAAAATNAEAGVEALNTYGGVTSKSKNLWRRLAQKKREMMLSLELDPRLAAL